MKKAQLQQVFTFILVAIVIITTLFFGIRMIGVITTSSCEAQIQTFSDRLEELTTSYTTRGTQQTTALRTPCGAQTICYFPATDVNLGDDPPGVSAGVVAQLQSSAELGTGSNTAPANVFIVEDNTIREIGLFERITTDDNQIMCTQQSGGRFQLLFVGDGRQVSVSSTN